MDKMTLEEVKESYFKIVSIQTKKLDKLKKQIFRIGTLRLIIVLAAIAAIYLLWGNIQLIIFAVFIAIVIFLPLLKYHNRLFLAKKYTELLLENATNELKGIDYNFAAFDGAPEKTDANHRFSFDLDIFGNHSFFQSINRTVTNYGKDRLADTLTNPSENKEDILLRQEAIKELSEQHELSAHFIAMGQMHSTGHLDVENLARQFAETKKLSTNLFYKIALWFVPAIFVILLLLLILNIISETIFIIGWFVLIAIASTSLKDINRKLNLFEKKVNTLKTYATLFNIIEESSFRSNFLTDIQTTLNKQGKASLAIHKLQSHVNNLNQGFTFIGILLLNPSMMWTIRYAVKIENWMKKNQDNISNWFDALSQFDSLLSLSVFAYNHPDYTYPQPENEFIFEGKALGHPMLNRDKCVRNDIYIRKDSYFLVVTGANMAGKSTYLRTIGINMVLANIGAPVFAASLRFYPYRLVTNLRTSDSLNDNESYFFAELKRLKMIIDRLQAGERLFIILDEILKGTNSEDKQKGSIALMKQLVSLNGNGIIATHDLALGELESEFPDNIKNYRFEADIQKDHLTFSYKIKEGVAQNMNACFLMKKMGITGL